MENNRKPLHFFLGANTPQGFVSRFDQLANPAEGWREFVLKGGPGTGKSSLMRKVAEHTAGRCGPEIKTSIADGTSPHVSAM